MNWENMRSPTRATLTNPNFQSSCELGKRLKYSRRPTFKNPSLNIRMNQEKLCPNLSFTVENRGNLYKMGLVTFQT